MSDKTRAAFEAWIGPAKLHNYKPTPDGSGGYAVAEVHWAWHGYQAAAAASDAEVARLNAALDHIVRRLQMDIDDGGRPDQWSMEDLVRVANKARQA